MTHRLLCLLPFAALVFPVSAGAEWRCDCTTILDSCAAEVSLADEFVEVATDTEQCARVDYFIDGRPFVAVVTEGRQRQDWIVSASEPDVLVQSCQVCRDNADAADTASAEPAASRADTEAAMLEPLIEVVPTYPEAAEGRDVPGFVEVELTVLPSGEVEDVSVIESEPPGLFDEAAVSAVRRWRYPPDAERDVQRVTDRLEFTPDAPAPRPASEDAAQEPARDSSGPANQCVREDVVYNYGEMVEVGLMNPCAEPIAVYTCAQGVGPRQGRWHCTGAGTDRQLLVPQGDDSAGGSVISSVADGLGSFELVDAYFLTRAPNTEYWWLACRADDSSCREDGREWTRALDGRPARVDPRLGSGPSLSRSY